MISSTFGSCSLTPWMNCPVARNRKAQHTQTTDSDQDMYETNTSTWIIHKDTLRYKTENNIKSECVNMLFDDTKITTYWICHLDTPGGGAVFRKWTNVKQKEVSELPRGNYKTNNVRGRWIRFGTPETINNKISSGWCLLSCKVRKLRSWRALV